MFTVNEFMTSKPYTLRETDTMDDARKIITEKHVRHIPVTDKNNHLLGLVTQRDVLAATEPELLKAASSESHESDSSIKISDIMIRNVKVLLETDSLRQAAMYMQSHKYGCLPVLSDDQLVGIITDSDFVAIAINLLEQAELLEDTPEIEDAMDDVELPEVEETL